MAATDPSTHPVVLAITALVGAGALKAGERMWNAYLRTKKTDPQSAKELREWLARELERVRAEAKATEKSLRDDYHSRLTEAQAIISRQAKEHEQCKVDMARLETEVTHLRNEVEELQEQLRMPATRRRPTRKETPSA